MKSFIEIKVNGADLYELNLEDLENLQDEIQTYIDEINTENEKNKENK